MKSPLFRDNVEDKEIKFLLPEDKDIVVNRNANKRSDIGGERNGR